MEKPITIKVLMIHGYGQSGPLLDIKTSRLQRALQEAFTNRTRICEVLFYFPTAPSRLVEPDLPEKSPTGGQLDMWTWCTDYSSGGNKFFDESKTISDLDNALGSIAEIIRQHGPFDGVIGFSSGACIAALIASLLEEGRKKVFEKGRPKNGMPYPSSFLRAGNIVQPPLKFAVCYSGFSLEHPKYSGFYQPQIQTPILHVLDTKPFHAMSLPLQLEVMESFDSGTTIENSPRVTNAAICPKPPPGSTDRLSTSNEELVPDYTIDLSDAAVSFDHSEAIRYQASRKYVLVKQLQSLIAIFRERELKLSLGGVHHETEESAGQTAAAMEISLRLTTELIASTLKMQGKLLIGRMKCRDLDLTYERGRTDSLHALNKQLRTDNAELNDHLRASEFEISELRKKNEALKTKLRKVLYDDEKEERGRG
ncbi:hypothetical protein V496_03166 [Pseudogymnoascus sp. VKM F-4515 (FW-2607)]|nr:hypothetical protein V496_03166 [Pseudogymnoascus sp. VKM F-4515 (FW-2607)]